jgi:hypothetical protein
MDIDSRIDDLHHSNFDENGRRGKWYCTQGEGWTFWPEGTKEITLGPESLLTIEQVSKEALSILQKYLTPSR